MDAMPVLMQKPNDSMNERNSACASGLPFTLSPIM